MKKIDEYQMRIALLQKQVDLHCKSQKKGNKHLENKLSSMIEQNHQLTEKVEELETQLIHQKFNSNLKTEFQQKVDEVEELQVKLRTQEKANTSLKQDNKDLMIF